MKFKCYLMNIFINNKNFSIYETKKHNIIKFETATKITTVAKLEKKEYNNLINELQEKFGYYCFDNIETFGYLCDKFNN